MAQQIYLKFQEFIRCAIDCLCSQNLLLIKTNGNNQLFQESCQKLSAFRLENRKENKMLGEIFGAHKIDK